MATAKPSAVAESDAEQARNYTFGLDDAPPARYTAVTAVLIGQFNTNADRIQAATASPRTDVTANPMPAGLRRQPCSAPPWPRSAAGVEARDRAALLEELWPAAKPYEWPTKRRLSLRWQLRRAWLRLLVRARDRTGTLARTQLQDRDPRRPPHHRRYAIPAMPECRIGHILKIAIDGDHKDYGLGTRTVLRLHRAYPGYAWHTTPRYDTSGTFWTALAERTSSAFTADRAAKAIDGAMREVAGNSGQDEDRVVGEYTPGAEINDGDDTFVVRFLYAFWRLCEQRIAGVEHIQVSHAAQLRAQRTGVHRTCASCGCGSKTRSRPPQQEARTGSTDGWSDARCASGNRANTDTR